MGEVVRRMPQPKRSDTEPDPLGAEESTVDDEKLKRWYRYGTGFISLVLVGLFLSKSDGNSAAATLAYLGLGAFGSMLITTAIIGVRFWGKRHDNKLRSLLSKPPLFLLAGVLGVVLLLWSFKGIDKDAVGYTQLGGKGEAVVDSRDMAVRNLIIAENDRSTRLLVTIINKTQLPLVLDRAEFGLRQEVPMACAGDFPIFGLSNRITVRNGKFQDEKLLAESGPLKGFSVKVSGRLELFCADTTLELRFPISLDLPPQESTNLAVDLPRKVRAVLKDMILYNEANRSKYPIGSTQQVDLHVDLTQKGATTVVWAKVGYEAANSWACLARNVGSSGAKQDDLRKTCKSDKP